MGRPGLILMAEDATTREYRILRAKTSMAKTTVILMMEIFTTIVTRLRSGIVGLLACLISGKARSM